MFKVHLHFKGVLSNKDLDVLDNCGVSLVDSGWFTVIDADSITSTMTVLLKTLSKISQEAYFIKIVELEDIVFRTNSYNPYLYCYAA